jgi:NAD(P)-dependent dehydrogenase (short-subunit alcohol dehydrogenase family)
MKKEILLKGKCALVTGGGTGIGLGIATELVDVGAQVILIGRREEPLKEAVIKLGGAVSYVVADLTEFEKLPGLVREIEKESPIDILVNNAGINLKGPFIDYSIEDYDKVVAIQEKATFFLTREVAKHMITRRTGNIINVSSLSARLGMQNNQAYTMCKGGIVALTRSLMMELAPYNIRVNSVNPGYVLTDIVRKINVNTPERLAVMEQATPLKRFGTIKDIGMAVAFLASDAAAFITGIDLFVDGGHGYASAI